MYIVLEVQNKSKYNCQFHTKQSSGGIYFAKKKKKKKPGIRPKNWENEKVLVFITLSLT